MAEDKNLKSGNGDDIVLDKNKTAEQYLKEAEKYYIVPMLVRNKFPDLVKLIVETESMDKEEREYWLQIMPIMSEDQIVKFRGILVNEKEQLQKLDQDYQGEMSKISRKHNAILDEAKLKQKIQNIREAEEKADLAEESKEAALLKELEGL